MHRLAQAALFGLLMSTSIAWSGDDYGSLKDSEPAEIAETQAHGCYYHRGRRYCARYCYWEIDGRRYCQRRLRQAHPQAYYYTREERIAPEARYRRRRH